MIVTFTISMDEEQARALNVTAAEEGKSRSEIIRAALAEYMNRPQGPEDFDNYDPVED